MRRLSAFQGLVKPWRLVALALAILTVAAAAADVSWTWAAALALCAALIGMPLTRPVGPRMRSRLSSDSPLARLAAASHLGAAATWLVLGALGVAAIRDGERDLLAGAVVIVGALATAATSVATRPATRGDLRLSTTAKASAKSLPWALASLSLSKTAAIAALALWPGVLARSLAAASALLLIVGGVLVAQRLAGRASQRERVLADIGTLDIDFCIYQSGPAGSSYQLKMWLPWLEASGLNYVVIAREEPLFTELSEIVDKPVIYAGSLRAVDDVLAHSGGTVVYVNNAATNTHAVRRYQLNHIQILHGDSEKASSRNPMSAMYDELWVAGQAAVDRYADFGVMIPEEKFRIVGRPQVAGIEGPRDGSEPFTALYAPTWNGFFGDADYSSLRFGTQIVQALLDEGCTVLFREHPYSAKSAELREYIAQIQALLEADRASTGRQHRWGPELFAELDLVGSFNASDVAVTDISAVPNDYLFSGKPLAMMEMQPDIMIEMEGRPSLASAVYRANPETDIPSWIAELVADRTLAEARVEARKYYLGDLPRDGYDGVFVTALQESVRAHAFKGELDTEV